MYKMLKNNYHSFNFFRGEPKNQRRNSKSTVTFKLHKLVHRVNGGTRKQVRVWK